MSNTYIVSVQFKKPGTNQVVSEKIEVQASSGENARAMMEAQYGKGSVKSTDRA